MKLCWYQFPTTGSGYTAYLMDRSGPRPVCIFCTLSREAWDSYGEIVRAIAQTERCDPAGFDAYELVTALNNSGAFPLGQYRLNHLMFEVKDRGSSSAWPVKFRITRINHPPISLEPFWLFIHGNSEPS